jgi:DHA1 family multidrug resistance protein-like MFS transporter
VRTRLVVLAASQVVLAAGITVVLPLLPDLQEANGLSTSQLGVVAGVSFLAGLVGQLGLARFVDRGFARQLLVGSVLVTTASLLWIPLTSGLWDLVAARFLEGLGYAMFVPAARAIAAAHDPDRVGQNLGRLSGAELAGVVVGPVAGALLAERFDLWVPFVVLAVAVAALAPVVARIDVGHLERARDTDPTPVRRLLRRPFVQRAALLEVAMILPSGVYDVLWAKFLRDLGASALLIGVSFTAFAIPYVVVAAFGSRVIDRVGAIPTALWGLAFTLPPIIAYGIVRDPEVLIAVAVLEGAANAFSIPAAQAAMVDAVDPSQIGTGQGIAGASGLAAAGLAAMVAAPVYEQVGATWTFMGTAVVMVVITAVALLLGARVSPRDRAARSGTALPPRTLD